MLLSPNRRQLKPIYQVTYTGKSTAVLIVGYVFKIIFLSWIPAILFSAFILNPHVLADEGFKFSHLVMITIGLALGLMILQLRAYLPKFSIWQHYRRILDQRHNNHQPQISIPLSATQTELNQGARNDYITGQQAQFPTRIRHSMIYEEFDAPTTKVAKHFFPIVAPPSAFSGKVNYQWLDVLFDVYRRRTKKSRSGEFRSTRYKLAYQACYTVWEVKLHKKVPHLIFDSKLARGRQFKFMYAKTQKLALDANLEAIFSVYAPQNYDLETLSFITPEVIVAILDMPDYDFEFIDDSLFCYAPLLSEEDLSGLQAQCLNLYAKVNDNLRLYTPAIPDQYPLTRRLLKNPWYEVVRLLPILGVAILMFILPFMTTGIGYFFVPLYLLFGAAIIFGVVFSVFKTYQENKRSSH